MNTDGVKSIPCSKHQTFFFSLVITRPLPAKLNMNWKFPSLSPLARCKACIRNIRHIFLNYVGIRDFRSNRSGSAVRCLGDACLFHLFWLWVAFSRFACPIAIYIYISFVYARRICSVFPFTSEYARIPCSLFPFFFFILSLSVVPHPQLCVVHPSVASQMYVTVWTAAPPIRYHAFNTCMYLMLTLWYALVHTIVRYLVYMFVASE